SFLFYGPFDIGSTGYLLPEQFIFQYINLPVLVSDINQWLQFVHHRQYSILQQNFAVPVIPFVEESFQIGCELVGQQICFPIENSGFVSDDILAGPLELPAQQRTDLLFDKHPAVKSTEIDLTTQVLKRQ